ncbi:MAG TPA: S-adenosyl-L-homocysteine hydrolase [Novosphingobium sp.]|nr:S-adenosyl-L-homocysteine hydrolase [Novosphingobium sp.]
MPAHAASADGSSEKLRRLDIMLMVTGLRCRKTPDNFTEDYGRFTSKHLSELNEASRDLKAELARRYGAVGAARALDQMSVVMANEYGGGHPWLSCGELRQVTRNLAVAQGREPLVEAADQLFSQARGPVLALASR